MSIRPLSILALSFVLGACAAAPCGGTPATGAGRDVRLVVVDQARWSMSAHNMQPWEVVLDTDDALAFRLHIAGPRLLPQADPLSRQTLMSIGGFLALAEDAAAAAGYRARVDLFPGGEPAADDLGQGFTAPGAVVHLGSARQDAATVSQLSSGSHFYHRRADSISQQEAIGSVCAVPSKEHHRGGGHLVSARISSSPHPTGGHDLGWRFDPYTADRARLCATAQRSLSNGTPKDDDDLAGRVRAAIRKVARSQRLLRGCIHKSGLFF